MLETRIDLAAHPVFATFTDGAGETHELRRGLRDLLRPEWRSVLDARPRLPTANELRPRVEEVEPAVGAERGALRGRAQRREDDPIRVRPQVQLGPADLGEVGEAALASAPKPLTRIS